MHGFFLTAMCSPGTSGSGPRQPSSSGSPSFLGGLKPPCADARSPQPQRLYRCAGYFVP